MKKFLPSLAAGVTTLVHILATVGLCGISGVVLGMIYDSSQLTFWIILIIVLFTAALEAKSKWEEITLKEMLEELSNQKDLFDRISEMSKRNDENLKKSVAKDSHAHTPASHTTAEENQPEKA